MTVPPHIASLMTSPMTVILPNPVEPYRCGRMPHPEVFMDYIAEGLGPRSWRYHLVEALEGMTKNFATPYIIFCPKVSRDGMPFPVNKYVRDLQGEFYEESMAWRGNLVVAKYRNPEYSAMTEASMADFPILRNYLSTHGCP
ncbi:hypothetical protein EW026_g2818 [Hermanssonia centrifuga]|uniref:Uncharacterized protein n=1 Tax=Hermanssonia centrifuga TaxID=98765 RepID=A0A4S4KRR4_9APHY|nr:hypothetical protein EW026_g2818 [Hermanssonia centrifuga]